MASRPIGIGLLLGLALTTVLAVAAGPAQAHAAYKDSDPPDEATISSSPSEIWAEFTEPVTEASYLKVFNPCGMQVDNEDSRADGYRIYVSMADNTSGTYRVEFFANSAIDTHNTRGEFTFTVTDGRGCPDSETGEVESDRERNRDGDSDVGAATGGSDTSGGVAAAGDTRADRRQSGDRHAGHRRNQSGQQRAAGDRRDQRPAVDESEAEPSGEAAEETNIFTGIPIGGLALALAFAAAIGAAGGFIYAGIMGYTRRA